jgi:3-deoxy-7-phosphoheptulonate synthase
VSDGDNQARELNISTAEMGLPAATAHLDPLLGEYPSDLVSWGAIGARTAESQTHRELASGVPFPVGMKNTTDGNVEAAANAAQAASRAHRFLGMADDGRVAIIRTTGNPDAHIVLRGGAGGPNFDPETVARAGEYLAARGLRKNVVVDLSHGNAQKRTDGQMLALESVARQVEAGGSGLRGVMIESNLVAGRQDLQAKHSLVYGQSITDPCADLDATETMLRRLAGARARARRGTSNRQAQQLN